MALSLGRVARGLIVSSPPTVSAAQAAKAKAKAPKEDPPVTVDVGRKPAAKPDVYGKGDLKKAQGPNPAEGADGRWQDGAYIAGRGAVSVDIQASESGYDNQVYWTSDNWQTKNLLGTDNHTGTMELGTFAPGTRIQFGIDNGQGEFFKAGAATQNTDGFDHARVTKAQGGVQLGFEDLHGGGDQDFNDVMLLVRSGTVAVPPPKSDTRSGLGDGTNPGKGDGRVRSPNDGTLNPGGPPPIGVTPPPPSAPPKAGEGDKQRQDNRSGLGDGTNPGKGADRAKSPNVGTQNPGGGRVGWPDAAATSSKAGLLRGYLRG